MRRLSLTCEYAPQNLVVFLFVLYPHDCRIYCIRISLKVCINGKCLLYGGEKWVNTYAWENCWPRSLWPSCCQKLLFALLNFIIFQLNKIQPFIIINKQRRVASKYCELSHLNKSITAQCEDRKTYRTHLHILQIRKSVSKTQQKAPSTLKMKQAIYNSPVLGSTGAHSQVKDGQKRYNSHAPKEQNRLANTLTQPINLMQLMSQSQQTNEQQQPQTYDPARYTGEAVVSNSDSRRTAQGPPSNPSQQHVQQNAHSLGRDLQGMGLITQVKKGEKMPTVISLHASTQKKQSTSNIDQGGGSNSQSHFFPESASAAYLLKPQKPEHKGRKTLVLDLDETLVHSSFKPPTGREPPADIVLPVDIEGRICHVYILVRPGCLKFLNEMARHYEVVIFTASLSKYADPLMDILDQKNVAPQRLFREHCTFHEQSGVFVKDMSRLGRSLQDVIIIDNSPLSYAFQPENGMPILSWYDDRLDTKLLELIPVLQLLSEVPDVRPILLACCTRDNVYLTDKSIMMCSRILDEQSKRQIKQEGQFYSEHNQDQGSREVKAAPHAKPQPKVNTWVLGPPQAQLTAEAEEQSNSSNQQSQPPVAQIQGGAVVRGKRNHFDNGLPQSSTTPLNYTKPQYLTQANSKQNLLNTSQTITTHTNGANVTPSKHHKTQATIDDDKQSLRTHTLIQDSLLHAANNTSTLDDEHNHMTHKHIAKKRPKTANRDTANLTKAPPSRTKHDKTPLKVSIGDSAFKKTVSQLMSPQFMTPKQASPMGINGVIMSGGGASSSHTPMVTAQSRTRTGYHTQKSMTGGGSQQQQEKREQQRSAQKVKVGVVGGRPMTTQNSNRNSTERNVLVSSINMLAKNMNTVTTQSSALQSSKTRASSARKKPTTFSERDLLMIGAQQTSHATKNLSKLAMTQGPNFITQATNANTLKQQQQQSRANSKTHNQTVAVNTNMEQQTQVTKVVSGGSLLSRLIQSGVASQAASPSSAQSAKKVAQSKVGNGGSVGKQKRMTSLSPGAELRDGSFTNGKSPGKIFSTVQQNQTYSQALNQLTQVGGGSTLLQTQQLLSQQNYANLIKGLGAATAGGTPNQFKSPSTNTSTPQASHNQLSKVNTSGGAQQHSSSKGVKLSTQMQTSALGHSNGYLLQKLSQTMGSGNNNSTGPTFISANGGPHHPHIHLQEMRQFENNNINQSSDTQISSMLNEFERTKNINKELLLMRNIGSPKQPQSHK